MDVRSLKPLLLEPFVFHDLRIEVIDVVDANHVPFWSCINHKHPWYEINYLTRGDVDIILDKKEFQAKKGDCILVPANTFHENWGTESGDDGFCIRFSLERDITAKNDGCFDEISHILKAPHPAPFQANVEPLLSAKSLYGLQSSFVQLLLSVCELFENNAYEKKVLISPTISNQVLIYLREYYQSKIHVEDVAKALNISYRALAKKFKAETGKSIIEALTEIRINAAKPLLLTTNYTLAQIASMVGFEDESYFSKTFTKFTQCPPSVFRK